MSWKAPVKSKWGNGYNTPNTSAAPVSTPVDTLDKYYDDERDRVKDQYKTDLAALGTNKNVQMQEAAINNELLKKYLPQMNQMSGLSGLGVSESANIDALSRYQNTVTDINRGYRESVDTLDRYRNADLASINAAEREEKIADQRDAYGVALEHIASGAITDADSLERYLTAVTPSVSDLQLQQLKALGESLVGEKGKKYGASVDDTGVSIVAKYGGNAPSTNPFANSNEPVNLAEAGSAFSVNAGGNSFVVESTGAVDPSVVKNAGTIDDGDVFLYDDAIYVKKNGTVYGVSGIGGNNNSENYSALYAYLKSGKTLKADDIKNPSTEGLDAYKEYKEEYDIENFEYTDAAGKKRRATLIPLPDETVRIAKLDTDYNARNSASGKVFSTTSVFDKNKYVRIDGKFYVVKDE